MYKGDIVRQCERPQHEGPRGRGAAWRSLILLVPVRLGGDVLNPAYTECVKVSYQMVTDALMTSTVDVAVHTLEAVKECEPGTLLFGDTCR